MRKQVAIPVAELSGTLMDQAAAASQDLARETRQ
jgi:hypothetical protein